jgi:hypothetical protein
MELLGSRRRIGRRGAWGWSSHTGTTLTKSHGTPVCFAFSCIRDHDLGAKQLQRVATCFGRPQPYAGALRIDMPEHRAGDLGLGRWRRSDLRRLASSDQTHVANEILGEGARRELLPARRLHDALGVGQLVEPERGDQVASLAVCDLDERGVRVGALARPEQHLPARPAIDAFPADVLAALQHRDAEGSILFDPIPAQEWVPGHGDEKLGIVLIAAAHVAAFGEKGDLGAVLIALRHLEDHAAALDEAAQSTCVLLHEVLEERVVVRERTKGHELDALERLDAQGLGLEAPGAEHGCEPRVLLGPPVAKLERGRAELGGSLFRSRAGGGRGRQEGERAQDQRRELESRDHLRNSIPLARQPKPRARRLYESPARKPGLRRSACHRP